MNGRILLWSGVAMLAAVAGCQREQPGVNRTAAAPLDRRECPKEWPWDTLLTFGGATTLSAPGPIQNVPEFHDCQRFVVVDSTTKQARYDGLFAIFATSRPGRLDTLVLMDSLSQNPAFADTLEYLRKVAGFGPTAGLPSAEIWAPDTGYAPLRIERGFNCLYLYRRGPGQSRWRAKIVPSGTVEADCSAPVNVDEVAGERLLVREDRGAPHDIVPQVAKWDWDSAGQQHYIGIYCGDRWCEVGDSVTFTTPSKRFLERVEPSGTSQPSQLPLAKQRVYGIKGWYDEQFLATLPAAGTSPQPTRVLGTLIPDSLLGQRVLGDFDNKWVPAAEVSLLVPRGEANPYEAKLNLAATQPRGPLNTIELCHGTGCPDVPGPLMQSQDPAWDNWYAKITRAGSGNVIYRSVKRCDLATTAFTVPGTARWRWLATDETTWMRCAKGCCEVH